MKGLKRKMYCPNCHRLIDYPPPIDMCPFCGWSIALSTIPQFIPNPILPFIPQPIFSFIPQPILQFISPKYISNGV